MKLFRSQWLWVLVLAAGLGLAPDCDVAVAQGPTNWPTATTVPGYADETNPPIMVVDQNRTVHAFVSQLVGDEDPETAVIYRQWTLADGWGKPNDVLLSPLKRSAKVMGAFLDNGGMLHVVFFGGDNTDANLYYSSAPASEAGKATAWSWPVLVGPAAIAPETAAIVGDGGENLAIVYNGNVEGIGLYALFSNDAGVTWSEPISVFQTFSEELWPAEIDTAIGADGVAHMFWRTVDKAGQGRLALYSKLKFGETVWSKPQVLADTPEGLGVASPAIIEHDGTVVAVFNLPPKINYRLSEDGGETWTPATEAYPLHIGVNGAIALAADSADRLHMFFGQRIPGTPDIHGMWHSEWLGGNWSPPEPVVSGPAVRDMTGDTAFDPYDARVVVPQGNVALVTWRSDPGLQGNGVWYSAKPLDAPELPVVPLPVLAQAAPLPSATATPTSAPEEIVAATPGAINLDLGAAPPPVTGNNPAEPILLAITPVVILTSLLMIWTLLRRRKQ